MKLEATFYPGDGISAPELLKGEVVCDDCRLVQPLVGLCDCR